jgi:iron complex transport system substrate-binding protein
MRQNVSGSQFVLIKERDFRVGADGRLIFTREFLLARGTCCGSRCLNCPFDHRRFSYQAKTSLKIISFVPSWTETFIAAGVVDAADANSLAIVGRTRFCIHPQDAVKNITVLGGTKNLHPNLASEVEKIRRLNPSCQIIAILDREENPRSYFDDLVSLGIQPFVTHVQRLPDVPREMKRIGDLLRAHEERDAARLFNEFAARFELVLSRRDRIQTDRILDRSLITAHSASDLNNQSKIQPAALLSAEQLAYVIWKAPWMVVSSKTLIASVLEYVLGRPEGSSESFLYAPGNSRYPVVADLPDSVLPIYSSEPFPFLKQADQLPPGLFVDGEIYSWFGIRLLRFLEEIQELSKSGKYS